MKPENKNKLYETREAAETELPVVVIGATAEYPYKIVGNKKTGYYIKEKAHTT